VPEALEASTNALIFVSFDATRSSVDIAGKMLRRFAPLPETDDAKSKPSYEDWRGGSGAGQYLYRYSGRSYVSL